MGRILGIDYGEKRIGLAISDKSKIFASTKDFIYNNDHLLENLKQIVDENEVEEIILGLPLKLNGEESESTISVKYFKEELDDFFDIKITLMDERLTTSYAEKLMISGNVRRNKRKQKIDSLSAQIFLQNYLDKIKKS